MQFHMIIDWNTGFNEWFIKFYSIYMKTFWLKKLYPQSLLIILLIYFRLFSSQVEELSKKDMIGNWLINVAYGPQVHPL